MSKIFRLHSGTTQNIEHWQELPSYIDHNMIDTIEDPSGLTAATQITSIPTPFARMDLVKSAFLYVSVKRQIDGNTIYHRMVSDALDVAETFFNIEAFKDKIEILEWSSGIYNNGGEIGIKDDSDLGKLLKSSNQKHKLLGETLKMFLIQDKASFNFSDLKNVYLLNYKNGPERLNIIGGTSPTSMFFSTSNNLSYVNISIANDRFFDSEFYPLYKRTPEFIKWVYTLQQAISNFSEKFKGLNNYLDLTLQYLPEDVRNQIKEINSSNANELYAQNYNNIEVKAAGNFAELFGFTLKSKKYNVKLSIEENDFIIESTKKVEGDTPCVLPIDPFNQELNYGGGKWQKDWYKNVPKIDDRPLSKRTLPNQTHIEYPYLTINDLLESYIIKLPYPIDNSKFFDGNYQISQAETDHGFVLPIKKEFFKYFSQKDLQGVVSNGKKMIEIKQMAGGVSVVLRIPIKKNAIIEFTKTYINSVLNDTIQKPDDINNLGVVIENQFTIAIYPFIKLDENINPHYRVLLVDRDVNALTKHFNYKLDFYKESRPLDPLPGIIKKNRSDKNQSPKVTTDYYIVEKDYDFIEVKHNLCNGVLIPLFSKPLNAGKKFKFAIDFGTTNTHIEFKEEETIKPFEINENDIQLGTLYMPDNKTLVALNKIVFGDSLVHILLEEFFPFQIGSDKNYSFPQRTIINDNDNFNPDESCYSLADFNIPFWYLKENRAINSKITTNLKWLEFKTDKKAEKRTRAFLKQIMLMLRNKVVFNGGDLKETEIVWFYPSSMSSYRKNRFENAWRDFYKKYFGDYNRLYKLSESFAPFYYYFSNESVRPNTRPAVNIDIGGGTTDIVVYLSDKPVALTSFRFASSSIFGDGYGNTKKNNGFVQKYEPIIKEVLSNSSANSLIALYEKINQSTKNSTELCEFFFSLSNNKLLNEKNIKLSFSELLTKDDDMKIVFVFFYSSIIYHLAKLMYSKELSIPEFITFSGNGAKLMPITSGDDNLKPLELLSKIIFQKIYLSPEDINVKLKMVDNPKEVTCKGGLEISNYNEFENVEIEVYDVLIGDIDNQTFKKNKIKYTDLKDNSLRISVQNEVLKFIDLFFELNETLNFNKNFGINLSNKEEYKSILKENVLNDLISGIDEKLIEVAGNESDKVEETLFFYALIGCINRLAYKIYSNNK